MPGQDGRVPSAWVAGIAAVLACVLLAAVGVAALRTDTASADTVLADGTAVLELADGTARDATEGDVVPRGATVRAGTTGAVLETRDREVHLGGDTAVTVLDGARQVLRSGFVLVDAADAPGVEMAADAATVTTRDDSLVRVDSGPLLRVGVLRGDAAQVRAAGRRATTTVATYYQVQVPNGGLPGPTSPLVLTGDRYERDLAGDLVTADEDLTALASRLEAGGTAGRVVFTALRSDVPSVPADARGSESTLGYLIATASREPDALAGRYDRVRDLRADGGSWGVVAAIVRAEVRQVSAALSALLGPGEAPAQANGPLDVAAMLGIGSVPAPGSDSGSDDGPGPSDDPDGGSGGQPTAPPGGGTEPPPSDPPRPTDPVTDPLPDPIADPVEDVIDTVLDLVSPRPAPPAAPAPAPLPLPVPVSAPALLPVPQVSPTPVLAGVELPPLLK